MDNNSNEMKETVQEGINAVEKMKENVEKLEQVKNVLAYPTGESVEHHDPEPGTSEVATVEVDLTTGHQNVVVPEERDEEDQDFISDKFEDLLTGDTSAEDIFNAALPDNVVEKTLKEDYNLELTPQELMEFVQLIRDYQKDRTVNVYARLPKPLVTEIKKQLMGSAGMMSANFTTAAAKAYARELMDEIISSAATDNMILDFNTEIDNLKNGLDADLKTITIEHTKDQLKKFREVAEKLKEKDPKNSEQLDHVADIIEDAYSLNSLYEAAKENKIKVRKYDLKDPKSAFVTFNKKYENSTLNIYDISCVPQVLRKVFPDEDEKKLLWFVVFFINYCSSMTPSKIEDHAFMYNVINNILWLNFGHDDEYSTTFMANIKKILDLRY